MFDAARTDDGVAFPALGEPVHAPEKVEELLSFIDHATTLARSVAKATGERLLFDNLECDGCGSRAWSVPPPYDFWKFKCCQCDEHDNSKDAMRAAMQLIDLTEKGLKEWEEKPSPATRIPMKLSDAATPKRPPSLKISMTKKRAEQDARDLALKNAGFPFIETRDGNAPSDEDEQYPPITLQNRQATRMIGAARDRQHGLGEDFELDKLKCEDCGGSDVVLAAPETRWKWECRNCGRVQIGRQQAELTRQIMCASAPSAAEILKDFDRQKSAVKGYSPSKAGAPAVISSRDVKVFDEQQLIDALTILPTMTADGEGKNRVKTTIERLSNSGEMRPLALPGPAWLAQIEEMQEAFPTFAQAIEEVIKPSLSILAAGGNARPVPLLLVGAPGAGKSHFAATLAEMMQVPVVKMDMSTASMSCLLSGLGPHWASSGPGEVFRALAFGRAGKLAAANPVFVLDEIDKIGGDPKFDPVGPLHALLEIESATNYEDESLPGIAMDASHIRWILTANETRPISAPILSRVHVIHIPEMTESEALHVRARIFAGVVGSLGLPEFDQSIPSSVLSSPGAKGPREFKTACVMAIGRALARGEFSVSEMDFQSGSAVRVRKMGFT
jgi:ATP-dependent Lon protease